MYYSRGGLNRSRGLSPLVAGPFILTTEKGLIMYYSRGRLNRSRGLSPLVAGPFSLITEKGLSEFPVHSVSNSCCSHIIPFLPFI